MSEISEGNFGFFGAKLLGKYISLFREHSEVNSALNFSNFESDASSNNLFCLSMYEAITSVNENGLLFTVIFPGALGDLLSRALSLCSIDIWVLRTYSTLGMLQDDNYDKFAESLFVESIDNPWPPAYHDEPVPIYSISSAIAAILKTKCKGYGDNNDIDVTSAEKNECKDITLFLPLGVGYTLRSFLPYELTDGFTGFPNKAQGLIAREMFVYESLLVPLFIRETAFVVSMVRHGLVSISDLTQYKLRTNSVLAQT